MKKQFLLATVVAGLALAPSAQAAPPGSGWTNVFSDDFNSLNTSVWSKGWAAKTSSGSILLDAKTRYAAYYDPANAYTEWSPSGNSNVFRVKTERRNFTVPWENNKVYRYVSGAIHSYSKKAFKYGYFEVRCSANHGKGMISDFWLVNNNDPKRWPPEIDIVEFDSRTGQAFFYNHYFDSNGVHRIPGLSRNITTNSFNTYGCLWEPGSLKWYVNGQYVGQITTAVPNEPLGMVLSSEIRDEAYANQDTAFPKTFSVDYVKVWQKSGVGL